MSKTLEVFHNESEGKYEVCTPDHSESFVVSGYTLDVGDKEILMEADRQTVDVGRDKYYHVEEKFGGSQVTVTVKDEPQSSVMSGEEVTIEREISDVTFSESDVQEAEFEAKNELLKNGIINPTPSTIRRKVREKLTDWAIEENWTIEEVLEKEAGKCVDLSIKD